MGFFSIQTVPFYTASTFIDFQIERNILRDEVVFPLNKKFEDEMVNVKNIDLRWGILPSDSEGEHEEKVLKVCTDQIKRTNSNVILFIGDRYGWVPDKDKIIPYLKGLELPPLKQISITALEIIYALNYKSEDSNIFIYMRNIINHEELDEETKSSFREEHQDLKVLKDYLIENYPELIRMYDVVWDKSKSRIIKPENFKSQLFNDLELTLQKYKTKVNEKDIVHKHLQKTLHHHVERNYTKKEVIDKLSDTSRRGVLISNLHSDGTSVLIASVISALRKAKKSVFYFSEDMKLDRKANIKELLQKPYLIRKPRNFQQAEKYFLDYMYIVNLPVIAENEQVLKVSGEYNKVVALLRQAITEYIKTNKHRHFFCIDGSSSFLKFLVPSHNVQFLTSKELSVPQFIVYTKSFQKNEAKKLLTNLAADSSKEISDKLIENLLSKKTVPKRRMFEDVSVMNDYMNNEMPFPESRPSYEEPGWIKQAFALLEVQTDFDKIEDYSNEIGGNIKDLRKDLIRVLIANLGETYTKFALSYIGILNSKATPDFISSLITHTLGNEATDLKFAELQNLLKDFCDFDERRVSFLKEKTDKLIFEFMRDQSMHSVCLPFMISFYNSHTPEDFTATDWRYFEEQLAFLVIEELSLDLNPDNQMRYSQFYKKILEKHVGLTEQNLPEYNNILDSLEDKWEESDYIKMREYMHIPYHLKESIELFYINWASNFYKNGQVLLNAFQAYIFISNTIHTDGKHLVLNRPENEQLLEEYEFFRRVLSYRYAVHRFID